jgi:hypothetical protein
MFIDEEKSTEAVQSMIDLGVSTSLDIGASTLSKLSSSSSLRSLQNYNQVIKFEGFCPMDELTVFGEAENPITRRYCTIMFFLEDETVQVVQRRDVDQPRPNSGGMTIVNRTRLPKDRFTDEALTFEDVEIGSTLSIFGREFFIYACPSSSRNFMRRYLDREVDEDIFEYYPPLLKKDSSIAPYHGRRTNDLGSAPSIGGMTKSGAGFAKYKNRCLNFIGIWDNRESLYGEVTRVNIHYFLSDDSIELIADRSANSGHGPQKTILSRGQVPKDVDRPNDGNLHWTEFSIGEQVSIYNKEILIVDVDPSTRDFFLTEIGRHLPEPIAVDPPRKPIVFEREIPPYMGFGSEEDSLASCVGSLMPEAPRKVYGENKVLNFLASMETTNVQDIDRKFVVSYYLLDDTIQVYEPPVKNSGIIGGTFLSRSVMKDERNRRITVDRLYVGARISIGGHIFDISNTDDATIRWIQSKPDLFPQAEYTYVMDRYKRVLGNLARNGTLEQRFRDIDTENTGFLSCEQFEAFLDSFNLAGREGKQGMLTVLRNIGRRRKRSLQWSKFVDILAERDEL